MKVTQLSVIAIAAKQPGTHGKPLGCFPVASLRSQ